MLMSLEQVDGDMAFEVDMLQRFCISAKEQLASCSRAARVCDIATLSSQAHSMRGGAAACCATQLAASCEALEQMACLEQDSILTMTDTSPAISSSKTPESWTTMVDDVAECLNKLSHHVGALASMHMLPSFTILVAACGNFNENMVSALSSLLEVAVSAYVAAHAAIATDEDCGIGEAPFIDAREKLGLACAAANTLSFEALECTMGLLSDHLADEHRSSLSDNTSTRMHRKNVYCLQSQKMLDDMRVIVESLAAELALILGERMPLLVVPFTEDDSNSVAGSQVGYTEEHTSSVAPINLLPNWINEPICDYSALLQNTGDDHKFVAALLRSFCNSLSILYDRLVNQSSLLFDAQSLHAAAVSMRVPRVVAAISDFIVATVDVQDAAVDIDDLELQRVSAVAVQISIGDVRVAVDELAKFLQAVEIGEAPSRVMMRRVVN
jgi:HPt (histidine-containing phosphotransfer) domain-containing protein